MSQNSINDSGDWTYNQAEEKHDHDADADVGRVSPVRNGLQ
jgi:hypothetical protein